MFVSCFTVSLLLLLVDVHSKTIDNKLIATPTIKCGPETIEIKARTEDDFEGVLYIKNWRKQSGCFTAYEKLKNTTKNPSYSIPLNDLSRCGLELRRHPKTKELELLTVFIFSFHPNFVTMSDRAFAVHCIFQQQTITVGTKFNFISDITTRATFNGLHTAPEPVLTIIDGRVPSENAASATRVKVGDPIMLLWNISHPSEVYGIQVVDCLAQTLDGRKMQIIENGCSTDDIIVSSVQYGEHNQKAFADAMAFKFPDAEDVWIKCSVKTCIQRKDHIIIASGISDEHVCRQESQCKLRKKRSWDDLPKNVVIDETGDNVHILHKKLQVIDVYADSESQTLFEPSFAALKAENESVSEICMLKSIYASSAAFLGTLYLTTILSSGIFIYSMKKRSQIQ
uniref:ZP domain-containing protein n=1 Tax=Panagrolaimus sp. JU765 TaxID=591449 RepID=A0AC34RIY6_9BILA